MIAGCALLGVMACGRDRFELHDDASRGDDGAVDTPGLPAHVCGMVTHSIAPVARDTELAVFANHGSSGFYVAWAKDGPVSGFAVDAALAITGGPPRTIIATPVSGVAGLIDTGEKLLVDTAMPNQFHAVWGLGEDLAGPVKLRDEMSLPAREPFASNVDQAPRVWVRSAGTNLVGALVHDDGSFDADNRYIGSGNVTALSMEDGPNHSHITWSEDLGGGKSRCFASDIYYQGPMAGVPSSAGTLSDDCSRVRTSSGPPAADSMMVVSQTAGHQIEARYLGASSVTRTLSFHGRAPRVRLDGAVFWIAWIDEGARDELHLASFDLAGNVQDVAVPGWTPVGDEAFQLVRRAGTVNLVVLSADAVSFLLTCQ